MKKILSCIVMVVVLLMSIGTATANQLRITQPTELDFPYDVKGDKRIDLQQFFTKNKIPQDKQNILINKLKKNELWDAYKPELQSQIPNNYFSFDPKLGRQSKYYRFPDGSFISVSIEPGNPEQPFNKAIQPLGSSSDSYGTTFWDYKVTKTVGAASAYVYADFFLAYPGNGYKSKIFKLYGANASGFGVKDSPNTEIIRPYEDLEKGRSALARAYWFSNVNLKFSWEGNGIDTSVGTTCSLWLGAIQGKLYVDSKLPY